MSHIKTNNYNQAIKEIGSMDQELIAKIPQEVENKNAKMYHVALVKITPKPGEVKNDVKVTIQQYHQNGFEKIQKSFMFQGFNKLILVHDPSVKKAVSPTKEEIEAKRLEAEKQLAADSLEQSKKLEDQKQEPKEPSQADILEKEYQDAIGGNKPELLDFAKQHGIDLGESSNNDQRKEVITAWFNTAMESTQS